MKRRQSSQSSRQVQDPSASFPRGLNGRRVPKTRPKDSCSQDQIPPGDPKTSEYAFFKKLKEDAGHRFQSQLSRHPDKNQSKKSTDLLRERTINLDNNCKAFKSSLVPNNVTPENSFSFLSPLGNASNKSEQDGTDFHKVWGIAQTLQENMDKCAAQDMDADIFYRKRQKLRQWVIDTSFPEIDKLCSKGCDFVAALISRLFPVRNEADTGLVEIDTKSKSFPSPCSDNYFREFHRMPARNLVELEFKLPPLDIGLSSCGMEIPRERELTYSSPPIHYSYRASHEYRMRELECGGDRNSPSSSIDYDYTFGFHAEKYGSYLSDSKRLDELYYPRKSICRRDPYPLLLGWDFENMMGARYTAVTDQDMQQSMYPISTDSQGDGEQWKHDGGLDEFLYPNKSLCGESYPLLLGWDVNNITKERYPSVTAPCMELSLCPISSCAQDDNQQSDSRLGVSKLHGPTLLSWHPITLHSLQLSPSASYGSHNFGEDLLEVKDNIVTFLNNFSSPLRDLEDNLNPSDCSNHNIAWRGGSLPISLISSSFYDLDSKGGA